MSQPEIKIPGKLRGFFEKKKRFKVAYGGRGGAKSYTLAGILLSHCYSNYSKIACFREYYNSIDDSVHSLLSEVINDSNFTGFNILKTTIDHYKGGKFRFKGLARSSSSVRSFQGFDYFWIEEAQFLQSLDVINEISKTIRKDESEIWLSANPLSSADPFAQRFIVPYQKELDRNEIYEDDLHLVVKINYYDNDWFPTVLEQERRHDKETLSRALYDHIWLGAFNDSVEDSIIKAEWFDAAIDAHKKLGIKPTGAVVCSHDPSDLGTDDKGLIIRHGILIKEAKSRSFGDINDGADWALDAAINARADLFTWDIVGVGTGLKRQVSQALSGKKIDFKMFCSSDDPDNPEKVYEPVEETDQKQKKNKDLFFNKRAQFYWMLRDKFYSTYLAVEKKQYIDPDKLISISSDIEDLRLLRSEVCRIPRVYNTSGKIQIMSKQKMKKLKIQSPNLADSLMMSLTIPNLVKNDDSPINFTTYY